MTVRRLFHIIILSIIVHEIIIVVIKFYDSSWLMSRKQGRSSFGVVIVDVVDIDC